MVRANLGQVREDLEQADRRVEETYYEWAAQLAREAASDALALAEAEHGLSPPPTGEIGELAERVDRLAEASAIEAELREPAAVLDDVLDPTLEPDHDPGPQRREGGSTDYLEAEDAEQAVQAASEIADACQAHLDEA